MKSPLQQHTLEMNSTLFSTLTDALVSAYNNYDLVEDVKMDLQIIGALSLGYLIYKRMGDFLSARDAKPAAEPAAAAPSNDPVTEKAAAAAPAPEAPATVMYHMDIIFFENTLDELVYYALDKLDMSPRELLKVMNKALPTVLYQSDINASLYRLYESGLVMPYEENNLVRYMIV